MPKITRALLALKYTYKNYAGKKTAGSETKEKPVWLIAERGFDAKESGFFFFRYMIENHPEIACFYLIENDSQDYQKVKETGPVIERGSAEHFKMLYLADALVSTHAFGYTPDMVVYSHLAKAGLFDPPGIQVFLQHGILDKDAEWIYRENFKPDMFVVSTEQERDIVTNVCKQPDSVVALTGLCRYDNLSIDTPPEKLILFMPTWRLWLQDASEEEFKASEYFRKIDEFLNSPYLEKVLRENGRKLVFYPHIEMQRFMNCFSGVEGVIIPDTAKVSVQEMLQKCEVLITDYSSVYFDVLYLKKPVIFYQWDRQRFVGEHYKGVFANYGDYGYVTSNSGVVIDYLRNYFIGKSLKLKEYPFVYRDQENCRRVYGEILRRSSKKWL